MITYKRLLPVVVMGLLMHGAVSAQQPDSVPDSAPDSAPGSNAASKAPAPGAEAKADQPKPEEKKIGWVIIQLRLEARKSLKQKGQWPRMEPNFAQEKNVTTNQEDLFRVLIKRLDTDSAMDGYIRWQLLSFLPPIKDVDEGADLFRKLIVTMPRVISQPEPKIPRKPSAPVSMTIGTQMAVMVDRVPVPGSRGRFAGFRPVLGVVTSGTGYGSRQTPGGFVFEADAANATAHLQRARATTDYANAPTLTYRDTLIAQFPQGRGLRFAALMQDAYDRVKAGERSSAMVIEAMVEESKALLDNQNISAARLLAFYGEVKKLFGVYRDVAVGVYLQGGEMKVDRESVDFSRSALQEILANLREAAKARAREEK